MIKVDFLCCVSLCVSKCYIVTIKQSTLWTQSVSLFMKGFIKKAFLLPWTGFHIHFPSCEKKTEPWMLIRAMQPYFVFLLLLFFHVQLAFETDSFDYQQSWDKCKPGGCRVLDSCSWWPYKARLVLTDHKHSRLAKNAFTHIHSHTHSLKWSHTPCEFNCLPVEKITLHCF